MSPRLTRDDLQPGFRGSCSANLPNICWNQTDLWTPYRNRGGRNLQIGWLSILSIHYKMTFISIWSAREGWRLQVLHITSHQRSVSLQHLLLSPCSSIPVTRPILQHLYFIYLDGCTAAPEYLIWGPHSTVVPNDTLLCSTFTTCYCKWMEQTRREYMVNEAELAAVVAFMNAVHIVLNIQMCCSI